jgi:hypothetical protein
VLNRWAAAARMAAVFRARSCRFEKGDLWSGNLGLRTVILDFAIVLTTETKLHRRRHHGKCWPENQANWLY